MATRPRSSGPPAVGGAIPIDRTRICVLYGTEPMLLRLCFDSLRSVIESVHHRFETVRFDGQTASLADIFDHLCSLSLLAPYKLIVVDAADVFVTAHRQALERYAAKPVDHATLILRSQKWHRGKLDQLIERVGCVIKCEPLPAGNAKTWLIDRAKDVYQRTLDPVAAMALVDRLGCDLMQLDGELAKLAVTVGADQRIGLSHIDHVVRRGGDEQAWAVQEAVLASLVQWASASGGRTAAAPGGRAGVIEKIHDLVDHAGQADVLVAYFVADLVRKLLLGAMMKRQGYGAQQIAQRFKLWGPRKRLFMTVLDRIDESALSRMFDQVIRFDVRSKTGRGSPVRNLECFCGLLAGQR